MPTYKAVIAYDGSVFSGFALQKDKRLKSVLGTLKEGFARVGIKSDIIGAGRTDKGVHATGQVICFQSAHFLDSQVQAIESLRFLLNAKLYPHIMVRSLHIVNDTFHGGSQFVRKRKLWSLGSSFLGNNFLTWFH